MTRRIRFPLVVDILLVDEPELMRTLNNHPDVSRHLVRSRRIVNETIRRKIQNHMKVGDTLLPVFTARTDPERKRRQEELARQLDALAEEGMSAQREEIKSLIGFVAGDGDIDVGVVVQRIVGRFFDSRYNATLSSYNAARTVDRWPRTNPFSALWYRLSGRLRRAKALIWSRGGNDTHCIHATAIGVHNVVDTLENMRSALEKDRQFPHQSFDAAVATHLKSPDTLVRSCTANVAVPGLNQTLHTGTLVVFRLRRIVADSRKIDDVFARGQWNECPANNVMMKLLELVWNGAKE